MDAPDPECCPVTDPNTPPDESPEVFGSALATLAGVQLRGEGLSPAELNEIGRRAGEAIRGAARERRQGGMSEEDARAWCEAAARSFVHVLRSSGGH
jgi:hypothetical protein